MFDPTKPEEFAPLDAAVVRAQLNALKALIDALAAQVTAQGSQLTSLLAQVLALADLVPVGGIIAWFKDTPGAPALPPNFVECNGQMLNDPESNLNGQLMPDINTGVQRFVRGGLTSGQLGGIDYFATAQADSSGIGSAQNFVTTDFSPGAVPLPPYVTAVYVMRIK